MMYSDLLPSKPWLQQLQNIKSKLFTGQLVVTNQSHCQWNIYLHQGQIVYANGGQHPIRRWLRNIALYCFAVDVSQPDIQKRLLDLSPLSDSEILLAWDYFLVLHWTNQKKLLAQQLANFVQAVTLEVLFDIIQSEDCTWEVIDHQQLTHHPNLLDVDKALMVTNNRWNEWRNAQLSGILPNLAPLISKPEILSQSMSASAFAALECSLNGQNSLREISVRTRRSEVQVSSSLLPYFNNSVISLVNIPDYPNPLNAYRQRENQPFIACVDDSTFICEQLEKIFVGAGFQFVGVTDSLRAVPTILAKKPVLIFLDLVMPNTNGYEICSYIRKVAAFRDTPIVILTGNDGIVDRVRAKMVGASDFLSKPIDPEAILQIVQKYIVAQPLG